MQMTFGEVFEKHSDFLLNDNHITLNYSNWNNKPENVEEMARVLNLGLDSFLFIDDSSFEVNMMRESLPDVTVHQVPENLDDYPLMFREWSNSFLNLESSTSNESKTMQYKEQFARDSAKEQFCGFGRLPAFTRYYYKCCI